MAREIEDVEMLAAAFQARQDIAADEARTIAEKVLGSSADIAEAATEWARTGAMSSAPDIEGFTPASLGQEFRPTQVFTILVALRRDPEHAKGMLKYFPGCRRGNRR